MKNSLYTVLYFCCVMTNIFCYQGTMRELNDQVIEDLIRTSDASILLIDNGNEVYLNSSKIIPRENGLFLKTKSREFVRIPNLYSNERGCFTTLSDQMVDSTVYPVIKCWNCNKSFNPNFYNKGKCPHCGEQN